MEFADPIKSEQLELSSKVVGTSEAEICVETQLCTPGNAHSAILQNNKVYSIKHLLLKNHFLI